MSRGASSEYLAEIVKSGVTMFPLVEMGLQSGTLRMCGLPYNVDYDGYTWYSTQELGSFSDITESASESAQVQFTLSGANQSVISAALSENVRGRPVTIMNVILTVAGSPPAPALVVDDNVWKGDLDTMQIVRRKPDSAISVTAVDRLAAWRSARPVDMSHSRQQMVDPTDTFFSRAADLVDKTVVWPSKEFFKQ